MRTIDAELVLEAGAVLGEGPVWDARQRRLLWVDIDAGRVHWLDPSRGAHDHLDVGQPVGAVAPRVAGGLVLAVRDGFATTDEQGHVRMLVDNVAERAGTRMNDGKCDPAGRFLVGTMAFDKRAGAAALYRLDADHSVTRVLSGVTISNGMDWFDGGGRMYYIDTPTQRVDVFDYDLDQGTPTNRRPFLEIAEETGSPDGMTLDADGCLWVALWNGSAVHRYTPAGQLDTVVRLPTAHVTSCCFGGPDLDQLYITSARTELTEAELAAQPHAGAVFACSPGVSGSPAVSYAG